ncbi:hypothetical protein D3C72_1480320 [compost metagenome]
MRQRVSGYRRGFRTLGCSALGFSLLHAFNHLAHGLQLIDRPRLVPVAGQTRLLAARRGGQLGRLLDGLFHLLDGFFAVQQAARRALALVGADQQALARAQRQRFAGRQFRAMTQV